MASEHIVSFEQAPYAFERASSRAIDEDGDAFVLSLIRARDEIESRWREGEAQLEAFVILAEQTDTIAAATARLERGFGELPEAVHAHAHFWLAYLLIRTGSRAEALDHLARAEALAPDAHLRARVRTARGTLEQAERNFERAEQEILAAQRAFRELGDPVHECVAAIYLAQVYSMLGRPVDAIEVWLEHEPRLPAKGALRKRGLLIAARVYLDRFDLEKGRELLELAKASLTTSSSFELAARTAMFDAELAWWEERWEDAEAHLDTWVHLATRVGARVHEAHGTYTRAMLSLDRGDPARALDDARYVRGIARELEYRAIVDGTSLIEACALAALGDHRGALVAYRTLRPSSNDGSTRTYYAAMCATTELMLAPGEPDPAAAAELRARAVANIAAMKVRDEQGTRWVDSNLMNRIAGRRVAKAAPSDPVAQSLVGAPRVTAVAPDGSAFELEGGERIDVTRRPLLQRLLACLAAHPDALVPFSALFQAGWPEDRSDPTALLARLRVAMSTLRLQGLGDALKAHKGGYLLTFPRTP